MNFFEVLKISYYPPSKAYAVNLTEINGKMEFSILIDSVEVQSISLALEGVKIERPMTHDIISDILNINNCKLKQVDIYKIKNGIFYSRLIIQNINKDEFQINCRPSDAIAIALRFFMPINVSEYVLNNISSKDMILDSNFDSIQEYKTQTSNDGIVEKLNSALNEAINKENYEVAAKLRDKINSLDNIK